MLVYSFDLTHTWGHSFDLTHTWVAGRYLQVWAASFCAKRGLSGCCHGNLKFLASGRSYPLPAGGSSKSGNCQATFNKVEVSKRHAPTLYPTDVPLKVVIFIPYRVECSRLNVQKKRNFKNASSNLMITVLT